MLHASAVVDHRQHAKNAQAADRSPANEFDESVGGISVWGDEHGAACVFAVVEGQKEAAAIIPICVRIAAKSEGAAAKLRYAHQDSKKVTEGAQRLKIAVGQSSYVRGESHAYQIER